MRSARFAPYGPLRGTLRPPPDKSISHRAALIAAMGEGETIIENYLDSADTRSTLAAVGALGASVEGESPTAIAPELRIGGVGLRGAAEAEIDVGNAGTLMRMLPGWLAGQERGRWTLDGDKSIRRRPVDRVVEPLREMGAAVEARDSRLPPIRVEGAPLHGIAYQSPVPSAQVKSCLLLAGLLAEGETEVVEPLATRDHTERLLRAAGAEVEIEERKEGGRAVTVSPAQRLELGQVSIPGDISAAAFAIVAAALTPESEVRVEGVGVNRERTGLLDVMRRMGADVEVGEVEERSGEPLADATVRYAPLHATRVEAEEVPRLIDELPLVALLGCFAHGETVVTGAGELRHKESDRIATVVDGLGSLGALIEATEDGFVVRGGNLRGGRIEARGDHRIAMLGAVAGIASAEGVEVAGIDSVAISYPRFERDLEALLPAAR